MNAKELLTQVRQLLSDPTKWTIGLLARDKDDRYAEPMSSEACSFCVIGALVKVSMNGETTTVEYQQAVDALRATIPISESFPQRYVSKYNDIISHEELLAWLDRAIAEAR